MKNLKRKDYLEKIAKKIVGLAEDAEINPEKLRKAFRQKARDNHPDLNPEQKKSTQYFKLVVQAKNHLEGQEENIKLLEDKKLVEEFLGEPVQELGSSYKEFLSAYEKWRRNQFYDMENKSIWPKR